MVRSFWYCVESPVRQLVFLVVLIMACGRAGYEPTPPAVRALSVSSTGTVFTQGQTRIEVVASFINEGDDDLIFRMCSLRHQDDPPGFSSRPIGDLPSLPAGASVAVRFAARLPWEVDGSTVIDVYAELESQDATALVTIDGAQQPLRFTYAPASDQPDLSALPTLIVTTYADELDGGPTVSTVTEAGGADDLSLREALTIVATSGVAHRITFDETLFSPTTAQPIGIINTAGLGDLPSLIVAGTAIDGQGLAVEIASASDPVLGAIDGLTIAAARVVIRGVSIHGFDTNIGASYADDLLLLDNSIGSRRSGSGAPILSLVNSARVVVRRTAITGAQAGTHIDSCPELTIRDGVLNRRTEVINSPDLLVQNNLSHLAHLYLTSSPRARIDGNTLDDGYSPYLQLDGVCEHTVISNNRMIGPNADVGGIIIVRGCARVRVTHTTFSQVHTANEFISLVDGANAGIQPPTIQAASTTQLAGTTSAEDGSVVELFVDDDGAMGQWLGDAEVTGGAFWLGELDLVAGQQLRATVTDTAGNTSQVSAVHMVP